MDVSALAASLAFLYAIFRSFGLCRPYCLVFVNITLCPADRDWCLARFNAGSKYFCKVVCVVQLQPTIKLAMSLKFNHIFTSEAAAYSFVHKPRGLCL